VGKRLVNGKISLLLDIFYPMPFVGVRALLQIISQQSR
jgi:hypothetical protein